MMTPQDAEVSHALAQLPQLMGLQLGMVYVGDQVRATRAGGRWRVFGNEPLQPGVAGALARRFSGAAAPAGQQEQRQQPAAEAEAGQTSYFKVSIIIEQEGSSSQQASELSSLGRALAAFDDVDLEIMWTGQACPAAAHALLQLVAARLVAFGIWDTSSAGVVLGALQRLRLPRLAQLRLHPCPQAQAPSECTPSTVKAVAGLDAPRLAAITIRGPFAGSRATVVAAVAALAVGRPQLVGPDGRPAGLTIEVSRAVLSDKELGEVSAAVAAASGPCWITLVRPSS